VKTEKKDSPTFVFASAHGCEPSSAGNRIKKAGTCDKGSETLKLKGCGQEKKKMINR